MTIYAARMLEYIAEQGWNPLAKFVRDEVLLRWPHFNWSLQGFGMMRTYLDVDKRWRLNIWDSSFTVPGVSTIHDHPWHFDSHVLSGRFTNRRYTRSAVQLPYDPAGSGWYDYHNIRTGPGGGQEGDVGRAYLVADGDEVYGPGDKYHQQAEELHESLYEDGTCTINDRRRLPDGEHALVFWPAGQKWVTAAPRDALASEIMPVVQKALRSWPFLI